MTTLLATASDLHGNSTVAVCPPRVHLDDGGTYHASPGQLQLWRWWVDYWNTLGNVSCDRKALILAGDLGELDLKKRSTQLVSVNKATIMALLLDLLQPALEWLGDGKIYIIRGTAAHVGKSSWLEEAIGQDLAAVQDKYGAHSHWHLRGTMDGARLDFSHHTSMSSVPWNQVDAANRISKQAYWNYKKAGTQLPHIINRGHVHKISDNGQNWPFIANTNPCWSMLTEHAYRTGRELDRPDIGGIWYEIDNGAVQWHKKLYEMKDNPWGNQL